MQAATKQTIVGIDPAFNSTGICVLTGVPGAWDIHILALVQTAPGAEKRAKNEDDLERCQSWLSLVRPHIAGADLVCVELPQCGGARMQARSMWTSGIAMGLVASLDCVAQQTVAPRQVRAAAGASGGEKEDVCAWAYELYPNAPWPSRMLRGERVKRADNHHLADALAAAVAGLKVRGMWD